MERHRVRDALLFVIALCLVLIVVRLYSSSGFMREAQAQSSDSSQVHLFACYTEKGNLCTWIPVQVNKDGYILTAKVK